MSMLCWFCGCVENALTAVEPVAGGQVAAQSNVAVVKGQQQQKTTSVKPVGRDAALPAVSAGSRRPVAATDEDDDDDDEDEDDDLEDDSGHDDDLDDEKDSNISDDGDEEEEEDTEGDDDEDDDSLDSDADD